MIFTGVWSGLMKDEVYKIYLISFTANTDILEYIISLLLIAGLGALLYLYSGHLGAALVYNQAAGIYQPSNDCEAFEK